MDFSPAYLLAIGEVAWINILLSGDNAVVIAMACRSLPDTQRRLGVALGAGAAVILRIVFAIAISWLLAVPFLKAVGGLMLLWIAISLARGQGEGDREIESSEKFWRAVGTIALADAAMSLDNVLAIAAIARGDEWLFIVGLILSIPLIVVGATLITNLLVKFPIIVWAGAALLGWVAGDLIAEDEALLPLVWNGSREIAIYSGAILGALVVLAVAFLLRRRDADMEAR